MNCKGWEERIALSAGGGLDPAIEAGVKQHLAECAGCREFAGGMEDSLNLLRSAHEEPIAAGHYTVVRAGVLARLEGQRRPWRRWEWAAGLAAGLAVAGVFVAMRPAETPKVIVAAVRRPEPPAVAMRMAEAGAQGENTGDRRVRPRGPGGRGASPGHRASLGTEPSVPAFPRIPVTAQNRGPETSALVEPLVVKLITNDPDVVIYWIADRKGDAQ